MKISSTDVSVAIITINRPQATGRCVESVLKQATEPKEIIIIDSSIDKKTGDEIRKIKARNKNKKIIYFYSNNRMYQPDARNKALSVAKGKVIAFLDDDCIAKEGWLAAIAESYNDSYVAAAGGPCINIDENGKPKEKIITTTKNQNFFNRAGDIVCKARKWIPPKPVETNMLAGGNMSFLVDRLKEIGCFDVFYSKDAAFREESDPQIALIKNGYKIIYNPKAYVEHTDHKTGGIHIDSPTTYYYWCGVNHRHLCDKYFSKFWSRLSWLTFSRNPPSLLIGLVLALVRRNKNILGWYSGLFG